MEKQNTQESRSGLEESAVQQDIHSIHIEQTVSDRQQKDQSEMMYVKLVGLPKADVNQISVTPGKRVQPVYKTPEQFKAFLSELIKPSTTSSHSYEHLLPTQGAPASLHQDMEPAPPSPVPPSPFRSSVLRNMKPAPTLPPRAFEQIKDSAMGVPKPPTPLPRSTPNMDRQPTSPSRAFEQIKDSTMGGSKPPVPSPRSTPNMDRPPVLPPRAER
ncbi:hypothetical protein ACTPIR_000854 [Enterococcus hirae]|uniref:hypothetical protein n=1 Tax=Enterococcus hirae TaxID=1354 RepID=UPI002072A48E|nr:hypothetical protein [Enterococcus hirae]